LKPVRGKSRFTKRILVREETWLALSRLKQPGETFDDLLVRMADMAAGWRLTSDLQAIREKREYKDFQGNRKCLLRY
jgi:hypothetical protein